MAYCSYCGQKLENVSPGDVCPNCGAEVKIYVRQEDGSYSCHHQPQQPQQEPGYRYPGQQEEASANINGLCIAGFICSFLIPILGLILSCVGLYQVNRSGSGGKRLAIAGIVISIVTWVISIIIFS